MQIIYDVDTNSIHTELQPEFDTSYSIIVEVSEKEEKHSVKVGGSLEWSDDLSNWAKKAAKLFHRQDRRSQSTTSEISPEDIRKSQEMTGGIPVLPMAPPPDLAMQEAMIKKGYRYEVIPVDAEVEPVYAKCIEDVASLMREEFRHTKCIVRFLGMIEWRK